MKKNTKTLMEFLRTFFFSLALLYDNLNDNLFIEGPKNRIEIFREKKKKTMKFSVNHKFDIILFPGMYDYRIFVTFKRLKNK